MRFRITFDSDENDSLRNMDKNLSDACKIGQLETVKEWLCDYMCIESVNKCHTPLMIASEYCDVEIVRFLINSGENIEEKCRDGETPLMMASKSGRNMIIKELLDNGANIENSDNCGWTALLHASFNNSLVSVRELLDRGANINHKSNTGGTALMLAAYWCSFNGLIEELLDRGAFPYEINDAGRSFLDSIYDETKKNELEKYMLGLSFDFKAAKR